MKLKFKDDYSEKIKKGFVVTVDKIKRNSDILGGYQVRVVSVWKNPVWFSIAWFV